MISFCKICNKEIKHKPSQLRIYCSKECQTKDKEIIIAEYVGCNDLEEWLKEEYLVNLKSVRQLAVIMYDNEKNFSSVNRWLKKFNIPLRHGSEAVKTQWINNDKRRVATSKAAKENLNTKEARDNLRAIMNTDEYKAKISAANKGQRNGMYMRTGEQHHNYNPNLSDEERRRFRKHYQDKTFRKEVFERDSYICQACGYDKGHILEAHHLDSWDKYPEKRYDLNNGVTLCKSCHKDFHMKYGYGNNSKEQFKEFMTKTN